MRSFQILAYTQVSDHISERTRVCMCAISRIQPFYWNRYSSSSSSIQTYVYIYKWVYYVQVLRRQRYAGLYVCMGLAIARELRAYKYRSSGGSKRRRRRRMHWRKVEWACTYYASRISRRRAADALEMQVSGARRLASSRYTRALSLSLGRIRARRECERKMGVMNF